MTKQQEAKLDDLHEQFIELRTELRARGGLLDRLERVEQGHAAHKTIVVKGLTVIGTITTIAAFAGSSAGAKVIRLFFGS